MSDKMQKIPEGCPEGQYVPRIRRHFISGCERPIEHWAAELAPIPEPEAQPEYHDSPPMSPKLAAANRRIFNSIIMARIPGEKIERLEPEPEKITDTRPSIAELHSRFIREQLWQFISIDEFIDAELRRAAMKEGK